MAPRRVVPVPPHLHQRRSPLGRNPLNDRAGLLLLRGDHHRGSGLDDPGLLGGDLRKTFAEQMGVVVGNGSDHRNQRLDHIGGIQPAPQPHLDDGHLHPPPSEMREGQRGDDLIGGQAGQPTHPRLDRLHLGGQVGFRDLLAVDQDPFGEAQEMRRGIQAGVVAGCAQGRVQEGADRSLAFGSRHVQAPVGALWIPLIRQQAPHTVQVEDLRRIPIAALDTVVDEAVQVVERFCVGDLGHGAEF